MAVLTVCIAGGAVETFLNVDLNCTVGAFRAEVGTRLGMKSFLLYAKLATGAINLKHADNSARLSEVGLEDGGELRAADNPGLKRAQQAQRRLKLGLTQVATSLNLGFEKVRKEVKTDGDKTRNDVAGVANQCTSMQADVAAIREAMVGQPPIVIPGQLELMEAVQNTFKVGRINELLLQFGIDRPPGVNKNGKARLLAEKAPTPELLALLRGNGHGRASQLGQTWRDNGRGEIPLDAFAASDVAEEGEGVRKRRRVRPIPFIDDSEPPIPDAQLAAELSPLVAELAEPQLDGMFAAS